MAPVAAPAIAARGLGRDFAGRPALAALDLTVARGEVLALLGHNGAGKTTTVRLLNGVLRPTRGGASVLGLDPWGNGRALRRRTGVATERPSLDPRLSARANLRLYAGLHEIPVREEAARIDAVLDRFGLTGRGDELVSGYSKGMRQRLALARCALHDPELYFLDEPSAGLDPVASRDLRTWISSLAREQGRTVLLCTHDLGEARRLADRVAVLRSGRLAAIGTPAELATHYGASRLEVEVEPDDAADARALLCAAGFEADGAGPGPSERRGPEEGDAPPGRAHRPHERDVITLAGTGRERAPDVARVLVEGGVRLVRLTPAEASLEDVYLAIYRDRGEGPA